MPSEPENERATQTKGEQRIIDAHAHVASTKFIPRSFMRGVADNLAVQLASRGVNANPRAILELTLAKLEDHECDELVREMDEAGYAEAVLLLPDYTHALKDCALTIAEMFACHRAILARHPGRFRVFAGVDPRWGDDGVALFEQGLRDYGFDGMKIYPPCGYAPGDRSLYPFYELCAYYRVPVLTHIGATSPALAFATSSPMQIDAPAHDFPTLDFILAHGSVHYPEECAMMCSHRPNVYLDVSGFAGAKPASLRRMFELGINHKILFGTDWPVFRMLGTQAALHAKTFAEGEALPAETSALDRACFFSRNLGRLLAKKRAAAE